MKSFSNSEFTEKCGLSNPTAIFKFRLNLLNISSKWESVDETPQLKQRRKQTALIRKQASESTCSGGDHPEDADLHVSKHHAASPASSFFLNSSLRRFNLPGGRCSPLAKQPGSSCTVREAPWGKWNHRESEGASQPCTPQRHHSKHPCPGSLGMGFTFSHAQEELLWLPCFH